MSNSPKPAVRGRIIIVDKDINMRNLLEMVLEDQIRVVTLPTAEEGLEAIQAEGPFDIVMASFSLPGMNGLEFLRQLSEQHPETVRILMTGGCADMSAVDQAVKAGHISRIVLKPFSLSTLREQLMQDMTDRA